MCVCVCVCRVRSTFLEADSPFVGRRFLTGFMTDGHASTRGRHVE